jgi:hypothetical protein
MTRALVPAIALALILSAAPASADFFTVPVDGTVFLKPVGGEAAGVTVFGFVTSLGDLVALFSGLPNMPSPNAEVELGFFSAGTEIDFFQSTDFGGTFLARSDSSDPSSIVAFSDPDNSLGFGGAVIEQTGVETWVFHLDDAASAGLDDDDNDVLIQLRVQSTVPEPALVGLVCAALSSMAFRRRRGVRR